MLDIILKILGILGIILLILLGIVFVFLLLVLFYPVTYRVSGRKSIENIDIKVKISWLFGLLRGRFFYPEPGNFVVKLLWFTLYDSKTAKESESSEDGMTEEAAVSKKETAAEKSKEKESVAENGATTNQPVTEAKTHPQGEMDETLKGAEKAQEDDTETVQEPQRKGIIAFLSAKYEKIKYTIIKIYDKIKHIWENFAFYRDLWKDEQTQKLLQHALFRLKKIWQNIHPRRLTADILFGTGAPDTTGYAMAVYGMLSPMLGKHVNITPDFEQSILQGEFYMAGHITVFQVVFHSLMVVFDKRLALLRSRIRNHKKQ